MDHISEIEELEALYGIPGERSLTKVATHVTPLYRKWIDASRFLVLATVGPEGVDASPRGDDGPVVRIADEKTIHLPDWRGNNRLDSLRNIVRDHRVSLMFMVPGCQNVVRVIGDAVLTADTQITGTFSRSGKSPKTVIVVTVGEVYFQCAKSIMRSRLWATDGEYPDVPTAGDFVKDTDAGFDARAYDDGYAEYAKPRMW